MTTPTAALVGEVRAALADMRTNYENGSDTSTERVTLWAYELEHLCGKADSLCDALEAAERELAGIHERAMEVFNAPIDTSRGIDTGEIHRSSARKATAMYIVSGGKKVAQPTPETPA